MAYRNIITGEIRELDTDLIAAWQAAGNPKADHWEPYTPPPEPPPVPTPDWSAFRGALLISEGVAAVMAAARAAGCEPGVTALPVALERAQSGDPTDFRACWALVAAAGQASPELIAEMVGLATSCHLPGDFIAALDAFAPRESPTPLP
jgi:hypothetical protein